MLPPVKGTSTFLPLSLTVPLNRAATPTAPAPSTSNLLRSMRSRTAAIISSSFTRTTSSTRRWIIEKVSSPGRFTAIPSAMVAIVGRVDSSPASREVRQLDAPAACTPMIVILGRSARAAIAIPAMRPPPPMGTTIASASGKSLNISKPSVPCPAITSGSSKA